MIQEKKTEEDKNETAIPAPVRSKGSILVVDDDKFLTDVYSLKFSQQGYVVHACLSVNDAIETLRGGFPADAIVFDIVMPGNDGFALLKMLLEEKLGKGAVKIALTNESDDTTKTKVIQLGADRLVVKASMIPSEVVAVVIEELGKHGK